MGCEGKLVEMNTEEKTKIKIIRNHCRCLTCQENGIVWFEDGEQWSKAFECVGSHEIWSVVTKALRESKEFEVVEDRIGMLKEGNS